MWLLENVVATTWFNLLLLASLIVLMILVILNFCQWKKLKNEYQELMQVIGKGEDLNENLKKFVKKIESVSRETEQLKNKADSIEKNMEKCLQKVGVVRYNAYGSAGNDLCFAVALLDFEDNGVVFNGIYSRDNTTATYAKPIEHGKSKYPLVKEEEEAIEIAKHNGYKCFLKLEQKG